METSPIRWLLNRTRCGQLLLCSVCRSRCRKSALEYKDKAWGGAWDWTDWICTVAGVGIGFGIHLLI
jgi:hypothetical protein